MQDRMEEIDQARNNLLIMYSENHKAVEKEEDFY